MSGRIIPTIWGQGWNFQELVHHPLSGLLWLGSELSWCQQGCHLAYANVLQWTYNRPQVCWKVNLLPSWTYLVLTNLCFILVVMSFFLFVCLFDGCNMWLAASHYSDQGLNPGHSSESLESQPLDHQETPSYCHSFKGRALPPSFLFHYSWYLMKK